MSGAQALEVCVQCILGLGVVAVYLASGFRTTGMCFICVSLALSMLYVTGHIPSLQSILNGILMLLKTLDIENKAKLFKRLNV